jgi:hypothetical protein
MSSDPAAMQRGSHRVVVVAVDVLLDFQQRVAHFDRHDDHADRQRVLLREFPVALVVARHRHDRAGAVAHQHEVGDVDRQRFARDRMQRAQAGVHAALLLRFEFGLGNAALLQFLDEGLQRGIGRGRALRERVLGGDAHERHAHQRVRARGEHVQRHVRAFDLERELQAFAAPIQLRCIVRTASGQPGSVSSPSSNSCA